MYEYPALVLLAMLLVVTGCSPTYRPQVSLKSSSVSNDVSSNPLPKGKYAHRPTEGSGMEVPIDTVTALDTLIYRLNRKWFFVETGKAYFIGYTDDMYSIAAHGEAAVEPLIRFLNTSANPHGKYGVVYTLHLIGINSIVAGRFYEEFTNKKARQALLSLLADQQVGSEAIRLLMRDPWQSDVTALFANLRKTSSNGWVLVNALKHHSITGLPIQQELSKKIGNVSFEYPKVMHFSRQERQAAAARHEMNPQDAQILGILKSIRALNISEVQIDDSLLSARQFWGNWSTEFGCENCVGVGGKRLSIKTFLDNMSESRIQYTVEGSGLRVCTSGEARQRILTWWDNQPECFRAQFSYDKALKNPTDAIRWGF